MSDKVKFTLYWLWSVFAGACMGFLAGYQVWGQ